MCRHLLRTKFSCELRTGFESHPQIRESAEHLGACRPTPPWRAAEKKRLRSCDNAGRARRSERRIGPSTSQIQQHASSIDITSRWAPARPGRDWRRGTSRSASVPRLRRRKASDEHPGSVAKPQACPGGPWPEDWSTGEHPGSVDWPLGCPGGTGPRAPPAVERAVAAAWTRSSAAARWEWRPERKAPSRSLRARRGAEPQRGRTSSAAWREAPADGHLVPVQWLRLHARVHLAQGPRRAPVGPAPLQLALVRKAQPVLAGREVRAAEPRAPKDRVGQETLPAAQSQPAERSPEPWARRAPRPRQPLERRGPQEQQRRSSGQPLERRRRSQEPAARSRPARPEARSKRRH